MTDYELLHLHVPHLPSASKTQRRLRTRVFLSDTIPWWLAPVGYGGLAVLSTIFIPMIYTPVKWYYVLVAYVISPLFALPVRPLAGRALSEGSPPHTKLSFWQCGTTLVVSA